MTRKIRLVPVYKYKCDSHECGSYRATELLGHGMKVAERVVENKIREQFKFMICSFDSHMVKSTTDATFIVGQIQEKFSAKDKRRYYAFVDLEKAFDRVPMEVVRWALRKAGVEK